MCGVKGKRNENGVSKRQVRELKERLDAFSTKGKLLERRVEDKGQHYPVLPGLSRNMYSSKNEVQTFFQAW
jgi:hypothetical protein